MPADRLSIPEILKRPAFDPGVLFGIVNFAYYASNGPFYAIVMSVALVLAFVISAFRLFPEFKMLPLALGGVSHAMVAIYAMMTLGIAGLPVWLPAIPFAMSCIMNAIELTWPDRWHALPDTLRRLVTGETFAALANGLLLMFSGGGGMFMTVVSIASVLVALALTLHDRSAWGRFVLAVNAVIAMIAALLNGNAYYAMAAGFTALGCLRLWWLKRAATPPLY